MWPFDQGIPQKLFCPSEGKFLPSKSTPNLPMQYTNTKMKKFYRFSTRFYFPAAPPPQRGQVQNRYCFIAFGATTFYIFSISPSPLSYFKAPRSAEQKLNDTNSQSRTRLQCQTNESLFLRPSFSSQLENLTIILTTTDVGRRFGLIYDVSKRLRRAFEKENSRATI